MKPAQKLTLLSVAFLCCFAGQVDAQVRLSPEAAEALVIETTAPAYPPIAKQVRAEGIVRVEIIVSDQGAVTSAKAISGHPLLQAAAVSAVKERKYKAYLVDGKPIPFITDVYLRFPSGVVTPEQRAFNNKQVVLAEKYFEKDRVCRDLVKAQKWKEAEEPCLASVKLADKLEEKRALEKMGAYEMWGYVLRGQKRYEQALKSFNRALEVVGPTLDETDAELGHLYGDIAITHHLLRDLPKARDLYKKAEQIYRQAHATFGQGDSDEWVERTKQQYLKSLKALLEYHLLAAEDDGAAAEVEEIKEALKGLP